MEALSSTRHRSGIRAPWVSLGTAALFAINAYGAPNESLDVNLNSIYLKNRSQKNFGVLSELILQLPYPISDTAKKTGKGPFGGITYFDDKILATTYTQEATVMGLGRIYYSTTVPGDTPTTFVPFINWFRRLSTKYTDPAATSTYSHNLNTWLTPGFMYSYRRDPKTAYHLDMELYSYTNMRNNRMRMGVSYLPKWPMILSASFERVSWDMSQEVTGKDLFMKGYSNELSVKAIVRNPPNGNFSLIIGYGTMHNEAVTAFLLQNIDTRGTYIGVEASAGVLAW
jgi:hypothetical protein